MMGNDERGTRRAPCEIVERLCVCSKACICNFRPSRRCTLIVCRKRPSDERLIPDKSLSVCTNLTQ